MLIDWFTVTAQVINFLVLVYLLKRFLYGPIIRAMDQREKRIALRLEEGQKKKDEAQQEMALYQKKNRDLDNQREEKLSRIKEEAEARRKEFINEARNEVDAIRARWHEAIQREKAAFLQNLRQRAGKQTCAIARRVLKDLANVDLERHIIRVFIERLRNLDDQERTALKESIRKSGRKINLRSAFEIPQDMAREIAAVLQNQGTDPVDLQLEISSDLICGIELKVHGRKIAWSLEDYVDTLEEAVVEALEGKRIESTD
ncbi:MAG: F0F1 ATP synthase subunit B [Desulfobacterales bacterium]|nr:F0F1 ATP synthase subunit B [Desulfobacterales bacterium]